MSKPIPIHSYLSREPVYISLDHATRRRKPKSNWKRKLSLFWYRLRIGTLLAIIITSSYFCAFALGQYYAPTQVMAYEKQVPVHVMSPVLERIAYAESGGNQFCTEKLVKKGACTHVGRVITRVNKNGSRDYGELQINDRVWGAKAKELGYDIMTKEGNEAMGIYIFEHYGTEPWYLSSKNW